MKKTIILFTLFILTCCQGQENTKGTIGINIEKRNELMLKKILEDQLSYGIPIYDDFYTGYNFNEKDYNVLIPDIDTLLANNGYKKPNKEEFKNEINEIFSRILDYNSISPIVYINFIDRCNRDIIYGRNDIVDYFGIYINKENSFISDFYAVPDILDYQKKYPKILEFENQLPKIQKRIDYDDEVKLSLWKDDENLSKKRRFNQLLLISRNKYLFNEDQSRFVWLTHNDEYFMESLVTVFGYTQDKKLLNWVMEKNHSKPERIVEEIIFVKDCQGKLEIREDILKYIEETTTNEEKTYAEVVLHYVGNLLEDRNNGKTEYTKEELYKITAYAANTIDYLSMKYRTIGMQSSARWNILGGYFYSLPSEKWEEMISVFKTNNYYNLPHLKEVINYAMQFDSVGAPN